MLGEIETMRLRSLAGLAVVGLRAGPAFAPAQPKSPAPPQASTVAVSPKQLDLGFTENVEISPTSVQLFDQKGDRVDIGAPRHSAKTDSEVQADVPHLDNGAYVVTWQVISADSHPVHGAVTFAVGRSSGHVDALAAELEAAQAGNKTVGVLFAIAR